MNCLRLLRTTGQLSCIFVVILATAASAYPHAVTAGLNSRPDVKARTAQFIITDYGAKDGGSVLCTAALVEAVAAAATLHRTSRQPTEVVVPAGSFLTGAFSLSTGVLLRLDPGAVLLASTRASDYPTVGWNSIFEGWNWDPALIDTANCTDTGIVGEGAIDGQQSKWVAGYDPQNNFLKPITWAKINGCEGECRPKLVRFTDCERVSVVGVTLRNSPDWTQLYRRCFDVLLQGLTVTGSQQWGNNDGVDFEAGGRIQVLDSVFRIGDDGIVFASGNTNPNRVASPGLPLTDVLVRNCTISSKSSAIKWEAIDFGGCDHGTLADMLIEDVTIERSSRGIGFQQRSGHGNFSNITVRRLTIETEYPTGTNWWGSGEAIWITNIPSTKREGPNIGTIAHLVFEDIDIRSENGVLLSGVGRPIGPITFRNVSITVAVLGNTTCRKGYEGAPTGCVDYRPLDCQVNGSSSYCPHTPATGVVLSEPTAGIRLEGAGVVDFEDVSVRYQYESGHRPGWWADECITNPRLSTSFDPWPYSQNFSMTGDRVKCYK